MIPSNDPVDLDSLLRAVNAEIARRDAQRPSAQQCRPEKPLPPVRNVPAIESLPQSLGEVLTFQDEAFVRAAYRCVLNRDPDESGLSTYLSLLRSGRLGKVDLLGALRSSPEGRK